MIKNKCSLLTRKLWTRISRFLAKKNIHLETKDDFKDLWLKSKWVLSQSKPIIPYLIVVTILGSLGSLLGVYSAIISKSLIDAAIGGNTGKVIQWLIIMITVTLVNMLLSPIVTLISTKVSVTYNQKMQRRIYEHVTRCQWLPVSKYHSVSLLTRINSDVSTISSTILGAIPGLVSLIVTFIASFVTLAYFAPIIAFAAVALSPILFILSRVFGKKLKVLYKASQEITIKYNSFMQESLQNLMILKTFCLENVNMNKLKEIQKDRFDLTIKNKKLGIASSLTLSFCSSAVYFTIFCWGVINISKGVTSYGTFTAMLQLYNNVKSPLSSLVSMFPAFIGCISAAERLMELESLPLEKEALPLLLDDYKEPHIHFKDVAFEYKDNSPVLQNVNLTIHPREIIGLVGPSGEGKTTLIRLLLSLIYCNKGEITINSTALTREHRNLISYVPQGNTLFTGTIEDNLRYGKADATKEEIIAAAKKACAHEFIINLNDGYNTLIGEKGVGISEGQAQRIAIARALLKKTPILILDEVTSSLDVDTELKVLTSIKNLNHTPTCIVITHRPSALAICDKIYKLKNGTLEASIYEDISKNIDALNEAELETAAN